MARRPPRAASSRLEAPEHRAHRADAARSAGRAADRLRGARADLRDPDLPRDQRLHARPGGQPLHPGHRPGEVPLARRQPRRPDPADRRRPADHRRRVPRPRPPGDAARLPQRADRRRGDRDERGGRARAWTRWRPGDSFDLYDWTRHVAMRVAMRALFGLDPDRSGVDVAATFERGLSFYEREYFLQVLRGPGSPFARLRRVRRTLDGIILGEIARRRRTERARRGPARAADRRHRRGRPGVRRRDRFATRS